ncbi:hypothetical protein EBZ38_06880 [bacterium]|nr:hypothetical protein [bacterium]
MRNFRLSVDLSDLYLELKRFVLREYSLPFSLIFIEAEDPDDACNTILIKLIKLLMDQDPSINTRILCRKIKRHMRIDKIAQL